MNWIFRIVVNRHITFHDAPGSISAKKFKNFSNISVSNIYFFDSSCFLRQTVHLLSIFLELDDKAAFTPTFCSYESFQFLKLTSE